MHAHTRPASTRSSWTLAPLAVAYLAFPLVMSIARLAEIELQRTWIDGVWALWATGCLLAILARGGRGLRITQAGVLAALLLVMATLARFGPAWFTDEPMLTPWLMELKPLFYLVLAWLTVSAVGLPSSRDFLRFSAALAALILLELALASLAAGEVVRPQGSGEINYDATLLLLGLGLGLTERARLLKILVLCGLLASMSRTTLLSAGLAALFCWPGLSWPRRLGLGLAMLGGIGLAFGLRGLSMDGLHELDRYWMWQTCITLFLENPVQFLTGFAPGVPLPVEAPQALWELWRDQTLQAGAPGVHAYNFHAFWLRLAVTWGLPGLLVFLALILPLLRLGPQARSLGLSMLVQGLTLGLFYLSNVALILLLALRLSRQQGPIFAKHRKLPRPARRAVAPAARQAGRAGPGKIQGADA